MAELGFTVACFHDAQRRVSMGDLVMPTRGLAA
jgi:hypothetical protein